HHAWIRWSAFHATRPGIDWERTLGRFPVEQELRMLFAAWGERATLLWLAPYTPPGQAQDPLDHAPFTIEQRVLAGCQRHGWSCGSTSAPHALFAARGTVPFGFPNWGRNVFHLNPDGHQATGLLLARELERLTQHGLL